MIRLLLFSGLTEPNGMWRDDASLNGVGNGESDGAGSGSDNSGGAAEMFSDNEKITLGLVGVAVLVLGSAVVITVVILSKKTTISCFQALVALLFPISLERLNVPSTSINGPSRRWRGGGGGGGGGGGESFPCTIAQESSTIVSMKCEQWLYHV